MKFEINSLNFFKIISQVARARNKSNLNDYLGNIFLSSEDNNLTLRATNLEITCEKTIPVKSITNGKCLLNGDILTKIANYFSTLDTIITCELIDNVLQIKYLNNNLEIKTTPLEDFPNIPKAGKFLTNLNLNTFIDLIKSVAFCASTSEIKPEISSVYLYSKHNELYAVATDSFRLAEKKTPFKIEEDINILISQKNINEELIILESLKSEKEENEIEIYSNENILTIQKDNLTLAIRAINGTFPDYKQLFPKEWNTKVEVNKTDLKNALNLSTIFVDNYSYIDLKIKIDEKLIKITSKNEKVGKLEKSITPNNLQGEDLEASYNSNYFLEGLSKLNSEKTELFFTTSQKPLFIKDSQDENFTYLLMPLNK